MVVDKSFTKEWIQRQRAANRGADPGLIEKQIYAFALLHYLVKTGKEFVFKGGTSLHLILHDQCDYLLIWMLLVGSHSTNLQSW
jgi:hypothetical protein